MRQTERFHEELLKFLRRLPDACSFTYSFGASFGAHGDSAILEREEQTPVINHVEPEVEEPSIVSSSPADQSAGGPPG